MSEPVAVIDCGTNTVRLLITETGGEIVRRQQIVRLGQGVDATGRFHADAIARTVAAVDEFAAEIASLGCSAVRFVATSAARDVSNRHELFERVEQLLPTARVGVISGADEARYSFAGALAGLTDVEGPVLVSDIGGGSTELVVGPHDLSMISLDIGSVRLRERILQLDPPDEAQVMFAAGWVDELLDESGLDLASATTWVGVAGTSTTLAALDLGLTSYDRAAVHHHRVSVATIGEWANRLLESTVAEIQQFPVVPAGRAEVIGAGSLICSRIAARTGAPEMIVSESDILDGVAAEMLARRHHNHS